MMSKKIKLNLDINSFLWITIAFITEVSVVLRKNIYRHHFYGLLDLEFALCYIFVVSPWLSFLEYYTRYLAKENLQKKLYYFIILRQIDKNLEEINSCNSLNN